MPADPMTSVDELITNCYPLPIAHEYKQYLSKDTLKDRCLQLRDVFDFTLRYLTVIAISDYFERGWFDRKADKSLHSRVIQRLVNPKTEDLMNILGDLLDVFKDEGQKMFMPELYTFAYDEEGEQSQNLDLVDRLIENLLHPFTEKDRNPRDEQALEELLGYCHPRLIELLRKLDFLRQYELIRVVECEAGSQRCKVVSLMGGDGYGVLETREFATPIGKPGITLFNPRTGELLTIHPFALFDRAQLSGSAPEDLFLYEKTQGSTLFYIGLKDNEFDMPYKKHQPITGPLKDEICLVLRVENWPPEAKLTAPVIVKEKGSWEWFQGLANNQSLEQLSKYKQEKYQERVYFEREYIEKEFKNFIAGDKHGFLVVGDSGTGKTNLMCYWVDQLIAKKRDIVLFYNCAEFASQEGLNLGAIAAKDAGGQPDFLALLKQLNEAREQSQQLFLFLDAINEYGEPEALLNSLWRDLLSIIPMGWYEWFRIVVSCRTEAWRKLDQQFTGRVKFHQSADGVEMRLYRFTLEELPGAYEKYQQQFNLQSSYANLSEPALRFIADPLNLRLVSESYEGAAVPPDPQTSEVFGRYLNKKLGADPKERVDPKEEKLRSLERRIIRRLVQLMYEAKSDELDESELYNDAEIGQAVMAADDVNTPYFRLVDKGVLTRVIVQQAETTAASLFWDESPKNVIKVRFTYDRFFEYLLSQLIFPPGKITPERVKELAAEADRQRYASLWGALKTRLIAYIEQDANALTDNSTLTVLAGEDETGGEKAEDHSGIIWKGVDHSTARFAMRGLLIDTLVSYGGIQPERIKRYLTNVLLGRNSEPEAIIAIIAGYNLRIPDVFEAAYSHSSPVIRQIAMQYTFFFWSRYRDQGEIYLDQLTQKASSEVKHAVPSEVWRKLSGEGLDMRRLPLLSAFLGVTLLVSGHLLSEPTATKRFVKNFVDLYNSFGPFKNLVAAAVKSWAGDAAIDAWKSGGIINVNTLAIFLRRPLNDPLRGEVKQFAPYMGIDRRPIREIEDRLFEWSKIGDGVVSLVLVGILVNRSIYEPEATLALLKKMFTDGNTMSQYNVARSMSSTLQRSLNPCPGYREFFEEVILDIWSGTETTTEIEGVTYGIGHLLFPLVFECQTIGQGKLTFVDRFLALPWQGDPFERLILLIQHLGAAATIAFRLVAFKPYPVLETLSQWFHVPDLSSQQKVILDQTIGGALARIWRAYPVDVETFLDREPEMLIHMYEAIKKESQGELNNFSGQGSVTSIVFLPAALPGLVKVLSNICDEGTNVDKEIRKIGSFFVDPKTVEDILHSVEVE